MDFPTPPFGLAITIMGILITYFISITGNISTTGFIFNTRFIYVTGFISNTGYKSITGYVSPKVSLAFQTSSDRILDSAWLDASARFLPCRTSVAIHAQGVAHPSPVLLL